MNQAIRLNGRTSSRRTGPGVRRTVSAPPFPTRLPGATPPGPARHRSGRLARITDWRERARAADYRAERLAQSCGVSIRELQRFFLCRTNSGPHHWLNELRQVEGLALLADGKSVKETALELRYEHPAHFSRDFKRFHTMPPSSVRSILSLRTLLGAALGRLLVAQSRVLVGIEARTLSHPC